MVFICYICNKEFKSSWHLTRHLENKKKCNNNINININNTTKISCKYCNKKFKYKSSVSRHITHLRCKKLPLNIKKTILDQNKNKKIKELHYTNKLLIHKHILPFGKENYNVFLKEKNILEILNKSIRDISFFLTKIHYDIVQHHNFYIPNRRNFKHIKVFNGKICLYIKTLDFKKRLTKNIMKQLNIWLSKYNNKISHTKKSLLMNCFKKYENNDVKYINTLYDNIDIFLLSYSNVMKVSILKIIKGEKSNTNTIDILDKILIYI